MTPTISLAMIVRNEEANLARCLNSITGDVDEIVIVDTGSQDATLHIARSFTDKIYSYEWNGDFSAARNFAISKCSGHWILSLDADEQLDSQVASLRQLIQSNRQAEVFLLPLVTSTGTQYERFSVVRLFRNTVEYRFAGRIHEQVVIRERNVVGVADAPAIRHNLVTRQEKNKKRQRNLQLLKQALASEPDNYYLKYYIGVEWLGIGKYEKALPCFQEAVANISLTSLFRAPAVRHLVDCLKFFERLDDALEVCLHECELNQNYTDIFFEAGAILAEKGKFKQAIEYFHKAIQLGAPSSLLYHSQGTESFLAFHHLGFCYEKIGCHDLAEECYWQALAANPNYIGPLCSLFLLKITNLPASDVFAYFKNKNSFLHEQWGETLADLFFEMELPELAAECYEQSQTLSAAKSVKRIRYFLYSGCIQEALQMINNFEKEKRSLDIVIEEIIAYIIQADYHTAKQRALDLWIDSPAQRSKAWALLAIIGCRSCGGGYSKPEKSREPEVIQTYLAVLENCLRYKGKYPEVIGDAAYTKLRSIVVKLLTESSAAGNLSLANFFQCKTGKIRSLLDYRYISVRSLYV